MHHTEPQERNRIAQYRTEWNGTEPKNETGERACARSMSDSDTSGRFWANCSGTFNDHNDYSMNFVVFFFLS